MTQPPEMFDSLRAVVGPQGFAAGADIEPRFLADWSPFAGGVPLAVVRPQTPAQVAGALRILCAHRQPVAVQGGLTGLVGGAVPQDGEIVLSTERLRRIEEVDPVGEVMVVEAGVTLAEIQAAAAPHGLMFPLDIGSRGSCRIGGNISTNAGGNHVIRYGNTRQSILGLDVALADGTRLDMMNRLQKNNTGYDLKHLFIGGEGTLGVVTRAVLKLQPIPRGRHVALCGLSNFGALVRFLTLARRELGDSMSAFELMWQEFYAMVLEHVPGIGRPLPPHFAIYALVEISGKNPENDRADFERVLAQALESGIVQDAVLAASGKQFEDLWRVRDGIAEIVQLIAPRVGFDISVQVKAMDAFVTEAREYLTSNFPRATHLFFGHVGDGNLHVTSGPHAADSGAAGSITERIYGLVRKHHGSVSAEHGIGFQKKPYLEYSRTPEEISLMRQLRRLFDPAGILNRGRIFD